MQDRQGGAARRSGSMATTVGAGTWPRTQVAFAALVLTVLIGFVHPGGIPSSYAQSPPIPFDLIGDQTPVRSCPGIPDTHLSDMG